MPNTPLAYLTPNIIKGPAHVWLDVAVPGAGARLTLGTDGTPESVANPSAKHLGKLMEGARVSIKPTLEQSFSDETDSPYRTIISAQEMMISGAWLQVFDTVLLQKMMAGMTYASGAQYEQITMGGNVTLATFSAAIIFALAEDPSKFGVVHFYKSYNEAGLEFDVTRKKDASSPFQLRGLSVSTRAAGDQIGSVWKQVA